MSPLTPEQIMEAQRLGLGDNLVKHREIRDQTVVISILSRTRDLIEGNVRENRQ